MKKQYQALRMYVVDYGADDIVRTSDPIVDGATGDGDFKLDWIDFGGGR